MFYDQEAKRAAITADSGGGLLTMHYRRISFQHFFFVLFFWWGRVRGSRRESVYTAVMDVSACAALSKIKKRQISEQTFNSVLLLFPSKADMGKLRLGGHMWPVKAF